MSILGNLKATFKQANQWFYHTPERSLDLAYKAALKIKAIEDDYFEGEKISLESGKYGQSSFAYFQAELTRYLGEIKLRMVEFNTSRTILKISEITQIPSNKVINNEINNNLENSTGLILDKLNFIDQVTKKYSGKSTALMVVKEPEIIIEPEEIYRPDQNSNQNINIDPDELAQIYTVPRRKKKNSISEKTGIIPRSILDTLNKIKNDLYPGSGTETEEFKKIRSSKQRTFISVKFILCLIFIPLFVQQITKLTVADYVVEKWWYKEESQIFLNVNLQEEAFKELETFKSQLEFKSLLGLIPKLEGEVLEEKMQEKAKELAGNYHDYSANALKNVISDSVAFLAVVIFLFLSQKQFSILKDFIDQIAYGLSDSAKAFLIILFTDVFVGFHSPHGWEVLIEGTFKHFGIAENREFIFVFIATFPVILDTMIKYWIFRYLNSLSPSAVATYKNMNE
jgi:CemA family